jgi:hypothetical protein
MQNSVKIRIFILMAILISMSALVRNPAAWADSSWAQTIPTAPSTPTSEPVATNTDAPPKPKASATQEPPQIAPSATTTETLALPATKTNTQTPSDTPAPSPTFTAEATKTGPTKQPTQELQSTQDPPGATSKGVLWWLVIPAAALGGLFIWYFRRREI